MKKLFVLTLLSFSISIFASVTVDDRKYKTIDHTENQTYECTTCNPLKFWLNTGKLTFENSTDEINFTFKLTDRAGEYRGDIEYYFGRNIYFDTDRYGEKGNLWFAVDVVYPRSRKKEVCFIHSYSVKSYSKVTGSWEPESYTELVFVGKDTQKKRITFKFKDPDQYVFNKILDYIVVGLDSKVFSSINLSYIPDYTFSENTLVVLNNGKKYGGVIESAASTKSVSSTQPNYVGDSENSSSSGKNDRKVEYISGGKRTMDYKDGVLYHSRIEYDDGRYEDCLYGGGAWVCEKYGPCQSCGGRKICAGCGGTGGIAGPYMFISCMNCSGSGKCRWCGGNGWAKTTTSSSTPPPVPLTYDSGSSSHSSTSSSSSSSSSRYGTYDCPSCYGSGKCQVCNGKRIQDNSYTSTSSVCRACGGNGRCSACGGTGKKYGVK